MKKNTKIKLSIGSLFVFFILVFCIKALAQDTCSTCVNSTVSGAQLDPTVKANIERNKTAYENAAKTQGIPWQMLAAVHCRETGLSCDPTRTPLCGEPLNKGCPDDGYQIYTLEGALNVAASKLKNNVYKVNPATSQSDDTLGKAFLSFNRGSMYLKGIKANGDPCPGQENTPYDKSPYVMNFMDENHQNMTWNGCIDSGLTNADSLLGTLTIYKLLGGSSENGACPIAGEVVDKGALDASLQEMLSSGAYGGNGSAVEQYLETFEVTTWNGSAEVKRTLTAHKLVSESLKSIFGELTQMKYPIVTAGCYREAQGATSGSSSSISAHRFGVACDINESYNFGDCGTDPYKVTPEVAAVFERHGWPIWGLCKSQCGNGDFNTFCDGMHFSTQEPAVSGIMK